MGGRVLMLCGVHDLLVEICCFCFCGCCWLLLLLFFFFFQAEDGIRDFCLSRELGDVYMRQVVLWCGVVWCGVAWCGVVWRGVVWCGVGPVSFSPLTLLSSDSV